MTLVRIMETGSYTGNGTSQSVTIGWQPGFVLTWSSKSGGNPNQRGAAFKATTMSGSNAIRVRQGTAFATDCVTLDSTGFSVGADDSVNRNGEVYHWVALRAGPTFDVASYTGTDPTDQVFTLNRQPTFLFHFDETVPHVGIKHPDQAGDAFWEYATSAGVQNGLTIAATGFTASADANIVGDALKYAAFYGLVGAGRHWETGSYTGDGAASQAILLGRQPKLVMIQAADTNNGIFKTDTMSGNNAGQIASSTDYIASLLTLDATGFTALTAINSTGVSYRWIAGFF